VREAFIGYMNDIGKRCFGFIGWAWVSGDSFCYGYLRQPRKVLNSYIIISG